MSIIKEIVLTKKRSDSNGEYMAQAHCVIRERNYDGRLTKFDRLFEEAQKTYPTLERSQVKVVCYGGDHYARTFGIEFTPPTGGDCVPCGWQEIPEVELTI